MLVKVTNKILSLHEVEEIITLLYLKTYSIVTFFSKYAVNKKYGKMKKVAVDVQGIKVIFSTEDSYSRFWLYTRCDRNKIHEENVTNLLAKNLKSCECFIDVGANLGYYTLLASKLMPNGVIYTFEMDKSNYTLLEKNLKLNKCNNVRGYHAALSDSLGIVSYIGDSKHPNPMFSLSVDESKAKSEKVISVQAITIDNFLEDKKSIPDVIKIDVEGAEMKVIRGMQNLLEKSNLKLFVEIHPIQLILKFQSSANAVISMLIDRGYDVFEITNMRKPSKDNIILRKLTQEDKLIHNTMLYAYKRELN